MFLWEPRLLFLLRETSISELGKTRNDIPQTWLKVDKLQFQCQISTSYRTSQMTSWSVTIQMEWRLSGKASVRTLMCWLLSDISCMSTLAHLPVVLFYRLLVFNFQTIPNSPTKPRSISVLTWWEKYPWSSRSKPLFLNKQHYTALWRIIQM